MGVVVVGVAEVDDVDPPEEEVAPALVVVSPSPVEPADVDVVVVRVAADDEWAVVSDATNTPSPTAPAVAATPISAVIRRTRAIARSRARPAAWCSSSGCRCPCAISSPFAEASIGNYVPTEWAFSTGC